MASQWAANLPIVTVPQAAEPKPFTLVLPFYQNHRFFADQVAKWREWDEVLRHFVSAIIVDDGSPTPATLPTDRPFPMRLFRVGVDVPWNWLAARNIGAHHAEPGWLLLTDMDHVVPEATAHALVFGRHNPNLIYVFQRREHTGQPVTPHSASFFMTREIFWRIGGYDEALSGHYGSDGEYRRRAAKTAPFQILTDELIRFERIEDSSTTRYERKLPADALFVKRAVERRPEKWVPKTLSFPYTEVPS